MFEIYCVISYYPIFCKFSYGISLEWVPVQACGTIFEKKQILLPGNKWVARLD
jgi:hypothetical protein